MLLNTSCSLPHVKMNMVKLKEEQRGIKWLFKGKMAKHTTAFHPKVELRGI